MFISPPHGTNTPQDTDREVAHSINSRQQGKRGSREAEVAEEQEWEEALTMHTERERERERKREKERENALMHSLKRVKKATKSCVTQLVVVKK
jgi:hypothetical protein